MALLAFCLWIKDIQFGGGGWFTDLKYTMLQGVLFDSCLLTYLAMSHIIRVFIHFGNDFWWNGAYGGRDQPTLRLKSRQIKGQPHIAVDLEGCQNGVCPYVCPQKDQLYSCHLWQMPNFFLKTSNDEDYTDSLSKFVLYMKLVSCHWEVACRAWML